MKHPIGVLNSLSPGQCPFDLLMGSFNSSTKILNDDTQDNDMQLPANLNREQLLEFCQLQHKPHSMLKRHFQPVENVHNCLNKQCDSAKGDSFRVLQWNILSQALGQVNDHFARCPLDALNWDVRKFQIIEEIIEYSPDIVCLQEVDHFNFLKQVLGTQGYNGHFHPKPDSPCMYIQGNNGPDGCAIFYRSARFELEAVYPHVLHIWRMPSNQVALLVQLRDLLTGRVFRVATTHLKARNGTLLATMRHEQGKNLLDFLAGEAPALAPLILCGDFNAEPMEPVYATVLNDARLGLCSAYATGGVEPAYTTWKIREEGGEVCHTIDYVFYAGHKMALDTILQLPNAEQIGQDRLPSYRYPSDHLALVCDFRYTHCEALMCSY